MLKAWKQRLVVFDCSVDFSLTNNHIDLYAVWFVLYIS